jgi:hypothetical protein
MSKNPRLLMSVFRDMINRSALDPEQKDAAARAFGSFIKAWKTKNRRQAERTMRTLLSILLQSE